MDSQTHPHPDRTHTGVSKMRQDHWYFQTGAPPAMEEALRPYTFAPQETTARTLSILGW